MGHNEGGSKRQFYTTIKLLGRFYISNLTACLKALEQKEVTHKGVEGKK